MENALGGLVKVLLPFLQVAEIKEVVGLSDINSFDSGIVVANHRGWLDGPILLGHLKKILPLMKSSYATNPLYKMFTKWFNFISLDSSTNEGLKRAQDDCIAHLASNEKLLIFPEGTRSLTNKLLPFKRLAFLLAVETQKPIFPIIIYSNLPFMTRNLASFFPLGKIEYKLIALDPLYPQDGESAEKLLSRCEKLMARKWRDLNRESINN
jgi:1-acyl-sn-glycerol-3-phosphate acyltransferase